MTMNVLNRGEQVILEGMAAGTADARQLRRAQALLMSPREQLRKAGILSGNFWLTM
jgi:uncharacterized protein YjeT (DUF2065 family)